MNVWIRKLRVALIGLSLTNLVAAAEPAARPLLDKFPIVAWGHPAPDEANLQAYQQAHFNIVQVPAADADAIRRANTFGFRAMLLNPEGAGASPTEWVTYAHKFENVMGWALGNAAPPADVPKLAGWIKELRQADPQRWTLVSVPPSDDGNWGATLGELLRAGMSAIAVHRLNWRADGTSDTNGFYTDLEASRRISAKIKIPLWGMIQVARSGSFRWASESDMRVQTYAYLAAGAKGLCYLTNWPTLQELGTAAPDEGEETADEIRLARRKQYEMESLSALNKETLALAPTLLGLTSTGLYFVGGGAAGLPTLDGSGQLIASVTAETAIVGTMIDGQGNAWAMLVNGRHGKQKAAVGQKSTIRVTVDSRVKRVAEVDRSNAFLKEIPLEDNVFYITVPGGTGSLLRLDTSNGAPGK